MAQTNYDDGSWNNGQDPTDPYATPAAPPAPDQSAWVPQIQQWYQQYLGRPASAEEIQSHMGNPGGLAGIQQAIQGSAEAKAYTPPKATETPTTPPPSGPDPNTVLPPGAPGFNDYFPNPFVPPAPPKVPNSPTPDTPYIPPTPNPGPAPAPPPTPTYAAPTFNAPNLPAAPQPFSYADFTPGQFKAPTPEEALNDPGYQFRLGQGRDVLEHSAAARGVLNTGGTLKDIEDYGQNAASGEYQNVYNRRANEFQTNEGDRFAAYNTNRAGALQAYNTNYGTQVVDPYARSYQQFTDTQLNPGMAAFGANVGAGNTAYATQNANNLLGYNANNAAESLGYSTQAAAGQHQNDMNYANAFNLYNFDYNKFRNYQNDTWNRLFQVSTA